MSTPPEFHLRRVDSDGAEGPLEICTWSDVPLDSKTSRRGFVGAGLTIGTLLNVMGRTQPGAAADAAEPAAVITAHRKSVQSLAFTPDGHQLVSCSDDRTIKVWSLADGRCIHRLNGHSESVVALALTPRGNLIASASRDKTIRLWSLPDGKFVRSLPGPALTEALVITPDGQTLISASWNKPIQFWSLPDGKLTNSLTNNPSVIYALAVSADGKLLASSGSNNSVNLWTLPGGIRHKDLAGHSPKVKSIAFAPAGRLIASGGSDKTIILLDVEDVRFRRELHGHSASVGALVALPQGGLLVSGSWDHTLKLWSIPEGENLKTFVGHHDQVNCVAVSPDGTTLASGDRQGVILLWNVATGACLGFLFDPEASQADAYVYTVKDPTSDRVLTYTLPCGSPAPAGATCVCNCVPGTYQPESRTTASSKAPKVTTPRNVPPPRQRTYQPPPRVQSNPLPSLFPTYPQPIYIPPYRPPFYTPGGSSSSCRCNKICTCIPVCQALRLLHPDPVVQSLAEQLLLIMGRNEFRYMSWAANRAVGGLKTRILAIVSSIHAGIQFNPQLAPSLRECVARLNDSDEVVAIMAAQMIDHQWSDLGLPSELQTRVADLLEVAARRPWYLRY